MPRSPRSAAWPMTWSESFVADLPPEPILTPLHKWLVGFVVAVGAGSFATAVVLVAWSL